MSDAKLSTLGDEKEPSLEEIEALMAALIMNPLAPGHTMGSTLADGRNCAELAESIVKPNDRLSAVERVAIYNRQYWFRLLDCLYDDLPGLRAVMGDERFFQFRVAYLSAFPSRSYSLRDLPSHIVEFLERNPKWGGRRSRLVLDVARFEWAQIVAFDSADLPSLSAEEFARIPPHELRIALQPYLTLLELEYELDDFIVALKKRDRERSEAGRIEEAGAGESTPMIQPRRAKTFLVVHRQNNSLFYKRVSRPEFRMLTALRDGATLLEACDRALRDPSLRAADDVSREIQQWFSEWAMLGWFCACR